MEQIHQAELLAATIKQIGTQLKSRRRALNLTQVKASAAIPVEIRHYQRIEGGGVDIRLTTLLKTLTFYNLQLKLEQLGIQGTESFYDMEAHIAFATSDLNREPSFLKNFTALQNELRKIPIKSTFETRPHKFTDGVDGQVAHKLTIEIDFANTTIQPHVGFAEQYCEAVAGVLEQDFNGYWEASQDEEQEAQP